MSDSPLRPRLIKGAFVQMGLESGVATYVLFQYNPETLNRSLEASHPLSGSKPDFSKILNAPSQSISLQVELTSLDQIDPPNPITQQMGVYPQLSALETLMYPSSLVVAAQTAELLTGTTEVIPVSAPLTLFIWGPSRVLPVNLKSMSIHEKAYDTHLNPIHVEVDISMKVLTYEDLSVTASGYYYFFTNHVFLEAMASISTGLDSAGLGYSIGA